MKWRILILALFTVGCSDSCAGKMTVEPGDDPVINDSGPEEMDSGLRWPIWPDGWVPPIDFVDSGTDASHPSDFEDSGAPVGVDSGVPVEMDAGTDSGTDSGAEEETDAGVCDDDDDDCDDDVDEDVDEDFDEDTDEDLDEDTDEDGCRDRRHRHRRHRHRWHR